MRTFCKVAFAAMFAVVAAASTDARADNREGGFLSGFANWLATPPTRPGDTRATRQRDTREQGTRQRNTRNNSSNSRRDYRTYRDADGNIDWDRYALTRVSRQDALATGTTAREVAFSGDYAPGSIVIHASDRKLYYILPGGRARAYSVGVGRPGFEWYGEHKISRKAEWPDWRPPAEMRQRQPELPVFMPGGPGNPMGARALYIGSTLYRIHGTIENQTIGMAVSSGCIRMLNQDVIDLYGRVRVGAKVYVKL